MTLQGEQYDTTEFHDFKSLYKDITSFQTYRKGATRRVPASQCTGPWLAANGTFRPLFITHNETVDQLLDLVAGMSSVSTLDARHQAPGPRLTGQQWVEHWQRRHGDDALLAVPALGVDSLHVSKCRPAGIGEVDLLALAPQGTKTLVKDVPVDTYVSYLPAKACTKFSISPAGACMWCGVNKGCVKVALIPPTPENLSAFAASLSTSPDEAIDFLPKVCQGTALAELCGEDKGVLLLPAGWIVAVAATNDATLIGGHFYRADSLSVHVDCWKLQERINSSSDNPLLSAQRLGGLFLNPEDGGMVQTRQAIHRIAATYANKLYSLAIPILGGSQALDVAIESRRVKLIEASKSKSKLVKPAIVAAHPVERRSRGEEGLGKRHGRRRFSKQSEDFIVSDDDDDQDDENVEEEWKPKEGLGDSSDFSDDSFGETTASERQATPFSKSREEDSTRKSSRLRLKSHKKGSTSFVEDEDGEQRAQNNVVIRDIEKKNTTFLTKIKLGKVAQTDPTIPQLDGAGDKESKRDNALASPRTGTDVDELSEEERQGLVGLVSGLLTWHIKWDVGQRKDIIPLIATLDVCLEVLGVSGASGLTVEGGDGRCSPANVQEKEEKREIGDETSPAQRIKAVLSGQSPNPKSQSAVQKSGKKNEMKKLSTKDRLKRKLRL